MEQLVRHMQETKHFSNLPKTYRSDIFELFKMELFPSPKK